MTAPDLLHLTRSCAKWMGGALLVATLLGCTPADAAPKLRVSGLVGLAPGDSLTYTLRWTAAARATGYLVRLSASGTNGTWSATGFQSGAVPLPASGPTNGLSLQFTAIATPWDSATFTATVESVDAIGPTGKTSSVSWKVKRRAGPPGPVTVDSSLIITGLMIQPHSLTVAPNTLSEPLCPFIRFANGAVAIGTGDRDLCAPHLAGFAAELARVSPAQQALADSICITWEAPDGGTVEYEPCSGVGVRPELLWRVALR